MLMKLSLVLLLAVCASARYTTRRPWRTTRGGRPLESISDRNGVKVWNDKGSFGKKDLSIFEANRPSSSWFILGHRAQNNYNTMSRSISAYRAKSFDRNALERPEGFTFIWDDRGGTTKDGSAWRPICRSGYVSVGDVFFRGNRLSSAPRDLFDKVRCVRENLTERCDIGNKIWDNAGAWGKYYISIWEARPYRNSVEGYFYARNQHNLALKPDRRLAPFFDVFSCFACSLFNKFRATYPENLLLYSIIA